MNLAEAQWFVRRQNQEHSDERPAISLAYRTPSEIAFQCVLLSFGLRLPSSSAGIALL